MYHSPSRGAPGWRRRSLIRRLLQTLWQILRLLLVGMAALGPAPPPPPLPPPPPPAYDQAEDGQKLKKR